MHLELFSVNAALSVFFFFSVKLQLTVSFDAFCKYILFGLMRIFGDTCENKNTKFDTTTFMF